MRRDTLYRHQQALDPSALTIVVAGVHAVAAAADDCRKAGHDPELDAAVILLARHLGRIAAIVPLTDQELRRRCAGQIAAIRGGSVRAGQERMPTPASPDMLPIAA